MSIIQAEYKKNDPLLLDKREYEVCKEYFKIVIGLMKQMYPEEAFSLVDVACASGGFIFHASQALRFKQCVGVDISDALIAKARACIAGAEFIEGSIYDLSVLNGRTFDVCTCLGTLSIFDDIETPLHNLLSLVKPGGALITYDLVNDDPVDTIIRYRLADEAADGHVWRTALNSVSRVTYEKVLAQLPGKIRFEWIDFEMPFAIPKTDNPMRAWTIATAQGKHQLVVGTGQLLTFKILCVQKMTE